MLLELAVGDAYGAGFEYANGNFVREHNDLSRHVKHPRHALVPGVYTDDTQMTFAIAELLIADDDWTPLNLASKFVEVFKRDPREGYSGRFYHFLKNVTDGKQFLAEIKPDSDKSGASMRAAPLGYIQDRKKLLEYCQIQAAVTHNTPDGIQAAQAAALMPHYFLYEGNDPKQLGKFLEAHVAGSWDESWRGKVKSKGWMSVRAAITAVKRNNTLSDLLKDCIAFTGDVDTVATIALGTASCSTAYTQDLPEHLVQSLENGKFGRVYITQLDQKLKAAFNQR